MTIRQTFIALLVAAAAGLTAPAKAAVLVQGQGPFAASAALSTKWTAPDALSQPTSAVPEVIADSFRSVATNIGDTPIGVGAIGTVGVTAVPEPGLWLLMIAGFGGFGMLMRGQQPIVQTSIRFS